MDNQLQIYTSPLLRTSKETFETAQELFSALDRLGIEHHELKSTKDYWCRDYMPVQLFQCGTYATYIYRPDYLWDKFSNHKYITNQNEAISDMNIDKWNMDIIFDGGNFVKNGKIIMTDKILTENPHLTTTQLIERLHSTMLSEIVLLPWDMTDPYGHADGIVAPLYDGRLLVNNFCQTAKGRKMDFYKRTIKILEANFELVELSYECKLEKDSWCYLNFLKVPGAVLLPCLSKDAKIDNDLAAIEIFNNLFPKDEIIPIYSKPLIERGGALHCVTWEYYEFRPDFEACESPLSCL